jgi:hypothetical protein
MPEARPYEARDSRTTLVSDAFGRALEAGIFAAL